jgi:Zn-dependent membrane protease YugP
LTGYLLVMVLGAVVSGVAALWVRSSYSRWSKRISTSGLSGAEVARAILDRNGLWNVRVEPVAGTLTDHYDPSRKAVRLSEGSFRGSSIAAVSVAAHECGHAIQDGTGYLPMKLRAGLLPIVNLGAQLWFPLFFAGLVMGGAGLGQLFIQLAVLAFAGVLAFHVVTLPVEFDASRRAYSLLTQYGLLARHEAGGTKRVLTAAAFTYVAAALTSLLTLLYLILVSRE